MALSPQKVFAVSIWVVLAVAIGIPLWDPKLFKDTGWVTYAGASIALLGLLTREYFALRAMRKQHTVSILLQSRLSTAFNERAKAVSAAYPTLPDITLVKQGDWDDPKKRDAMEGLKYLLNYYEFISIGIRNGDLDEEYLRMSLGHIVPALCRVGDAYIQHAQTKDSELFCNLLWLRDRWARNADEQPKPSARNPVRPTIEKP